MSERLLRLACTAAVTASALLAATPATAAWDPARETKDPPKARPVSQLLTDLQHLYRQAERATETYDATVEEVRNQQAEVARLDGRLAKARLTLLGSRAEAGRLARQQYQSSTEISPYVRLLLARDPQHALEEGHVIGQLARERAASVRQLAGAEKRADELARKAREALDQQLGLGQRREKERDEVARGLKDVEGLLASLSPGQLAAVAEAERNAAQAAQHQLLASGALGADRPPSEKGDKALRYALDQLGKPYEWGAEGPTAYDCSGLTSQAWEHAGRAIPRTSQEQWAQLPHVPLARLRPGDLVVYFPEATHVALYLGDGMVVQAPRPGTRIKVSPIAANPVLGAVRPDPDGRPEEDYAAPELPGTATDGPNEAYGAADDGSQAPATEAR